MGNYYNCVTYHRYEIIGEVVELHLDFVYIVYAIGLIGSILLTLTLARGFVLRAQPLYTFILVIAIWDVIYYAFYILLYAVMRYLEVNEIAFTETTKVFAIIMVHGIPYVALSSRLVGASVTTLMAITQYQITQHSLNMRLDAVPSKKNIWVKIGVIVAVCALAGAVAIPVDYVNKEKGSYYARTNEQYDSLYYVFAIATAAVTKFTFPLVVAVCNIRILMLRRRALRRLRRGGIDVISQHRRRRTSTMCRNVVEPGPVALLLSSTALFCVTSVPDIAIYIKCYMDDHGFICDWRWQLYFLITDVCIASRFAFNFYLNFAVSGTIRKLLYMRLVCARIDQSCMVKSSDGAIELTQTVDKLWENRNRRADSTHSADSDS